MNTYSQMHIANGAVRPLLAGIPTCGLSVGFLRSLEGLLWRAPGIGHELSLYLLADVSEGEMCEISAYSSYI